MPASFAESTAAKHTAPNLLEALAGPMNAIEAGRGRSELDPHNDRILDHVPS